MSEIALNIEGMHCDACVRRATQALEKTPGVDVVEVRVGSARIKADDPAQAIAALEKAGYTARAESTHP